MLQSLIDRKRFLFNKLQDRTLAKLQLKVCKKTFISDNKDIVWEIYSDK